MDVDPPRIRPPIPVELWLRMRRLDAHCDFNLRRCDDDTQWKEVMPGNCGQGRTATGRGWHVMIKSRPVWEAQGRRPVYASVHGWRLNDTLERAVVMAEGDVSRALAGTDRHRQSADTQ